MPKIPRDAILIPIDMQRAFDAAPWPKRWNDKLDENGLALLAAWRASGRTIIHVRHDSVEPGSTLRPDSSGHRLRPGFEPLAHEVLVAKSVNAAFIGTDLDLRLRCLNARMIVLFGISTDMCVSTSVRVGANLGYDVVLVDDACDCFDLPDGQGGTIAARDIHRAHIATLRHEFATVSWTADIVSSL